MIPIPVPKEAIAARTDCVLVNMGPPPGVSPDDCGTPEMLVQNSGQRPLPGFAGRAFYVYYRPSEEELDQLRNGGFIEFCQLGNMVQPFSAAVWPVTRTADGEATS